MTHQPQRISSFPLDADHVIQQFGHTVLLELVDGKRDHYYLAQKLLDYRTCRKAFLMQRSSTLILGPEDGWTAEGSFYAHLLDALDQGIELFHVVSLPGIAAHLTRPRSRFPSMLQALDGLTSVSDTVGIQGKSGHFLLKKQPQDATHPDMKSDRQARTLVVECHDGQAEGVVVVDLGFSQVSFHLKGPLMKTYFKSCMDFYHACEVLTWADIEPLAENTSADRRGTENL